MLLSFVCIIVIDEMISINDNNNNNVVFRQDRIENGIKSIRSEQEVLTRVLCWMMKGQKKKLKHTFFILLQHIYVMLIISSIMTYLDRNDMSLWNFLVF